MKIQKILLCMACLACCAVAMAVGLSAPYKPPVLTTKYYYHWHRSEGRPHPEDLILALDFEQSGNLYNAYFYCTTDEYDFPRKDYLPGFWVLNAYIGSDDKVSKGIYLLNFYPRGTMNFDRPVDIRYRSNDDVWKSGKYKIWRYTTKARPNVISYTLVIESDGTLTLKGNGRPARKFVRMDKAKIQSINRNTYSESQLASNRKDNPVNLPRPAAKSDTTAIRYPDQSCYQGEVSGNRVPNGRGRKVWANGMTYEGEWTNNRQHGKGVMTWSSGSRYEGDWVNGARTGKGKMRWANGDTYEGDWVDNQQSGQGKAYWTENDCVYEGSFANDKRNGNGVMVWGEKSKWPGDRYEGQWEDGWRTGQGTYYYADGRIEKGRWDRNALVEPDKAPALSRDVQPVRKDTMTAEMKKRLAEISLSIKLDALANNKKIPVDDKKLKQWVKDKPEEYQALLNTFRKDPGSLTTQQAHALYYGARHLPDFVPLDRSQVLLCQVAQHECIYDEAYEHSRCLLESYPLSLALLWTALKAAFELGKKEEHTLYILQTAKVVTAICSSGTGFNEGSPLLVSFEDDALSFATDFMQSEVMKVEERKGCSVLTLTDNNSDGSAILLYFRQAKK